MICAREACLRPSFNEERLERVRKSAKCNHSKEVFRRSDFFVECRRLDSSLASFEARVGLVARRFFGTISARLTRSASLSSASSRFLVWLRMSLATTRMLPSLVMRDPSFSLSLVRCFSSSARDAETFQKISTREEVLLTCCPPAPDDRETRTSSSLRGIESDSLTTSRFCGAVADGSLTPSAPAKEFERGEEGDDAPHQNDDHLWGDSGKGRALEHVGAQGIVDRRERQQLDEWLHHDRKVRRREEHPGENPHWQHDEIHDARHRLCRARACGAQQSQPAKRDRC